MKKPPHEATAASITTITTSTTRVQQEREDIEPAFEAFRIRIVLFFFFDFPLLYPRRLSLYTLLSLEYL